MYGKVLVFGAGVAVGFVLGSREGRQAYHKLRRRARALWEQPAVQKSVDAARDAVREHVPGGEEIVDVVDAAVDASASARS